jgi:predicted phosphodiesterase
MNAQVSEPRALDAILNECTRVAETRGVAVLIPGDMHLWGKQGGNRSDLFLEILKRLPFRYLLTNGDLFDGVTPERQTTHDVEVLTHIHALDTENRWIPLRGNHDRRLLANPRYVSERLLKKNTTLSPTHVEALAWVPRARMVSEVVVSVVEDEVYFGPAHQDGEKYLDRHEAHPGSHDLVVLSIGKQNFLFEHGDKHDHLCGKLGTKKSILSVVGSTVYNAMVTVEQTSDRVGKMSGALKQKFSMWRGVCEDVAVGATRWAEVLDVPIHGTVSGHTHYPLHTVIDTIPHVNVGSFRGRRPSFAIITEDGELLPPFVIRA